MKAISKQYQAQIRKFKLKILNRVQQSANEISSSDLFKSGRYFTKRFFATVCVIIFIKLLLCKIFSVLHREREQMTDAVKTAQPPSFTPKLSQTVPGF